MANPKLCTSQEVAGIFTNIEEKLLDLQELIGENRAIWLEARVSIQDDLNFLKAIFRELV